MADTHVSTVIREFATVAAIMTAGAWALWRWVFEERLRRHRDFPALDGDISTAEVPLPNEQIALTITALWRNRGKLPVEVDPRKTFITVYRIPSDVKCGPLKLDSEQMECTYSVEPLGDSSSYILEPGTDSVIQHCFVVQKDEILLFRWAICLSGTQRAYPYFETERWCTRQIVWGAKNPEDLPRAGV